MKIKALPYLLLITILFSCATDDGWVPLFNGENLEGWHVYHDGKNYNGWYVDNEVLVFDPQKRTEAKNANLVTDKEYGSFELSFDWMISSHGNSGLLWAEGEIDTIDQSQHLSPEIQLLDDGWTEYIAERGDINRAGSLYNLMAPTKVVSKPYGEWNHYVLHIDYLKNEGFLIFNGEKVLEFPVSGPDWQALVDQSPYKDRKGFGQAKTGHMMIQEHGGKVAFRDMKIKELNTGS